MDIRRWFFWIAINLIVLLTDIRAKTFNLNEAIAAEEGKYDSETTTTRTLRPKISDTIAESFSLNKVLNLNSLKPKRIKLPTIFSKADNNLTSKNKKVSSLKYRKAFQIKPPLKPKRLRQVIRRRHRKNKANKREANENEKINPKPIPLLRNIGMLLDNILLSSSDEEHEINANDSRQVELSSEERNKADCTCARRSDPEAAESNTYKTTITTAEAPSLQITLHDEEPTKIFATTTTPYTPSAADFRSFRYDQKLPLLLARNTDSSGRNDNAFSERGRATLHGGLKRNITRNNGNSKHNTGNGKTEASTGSYEEDSCSVTRDSTGGVGSDGRFCGTRNNNITATKASKKTSQIENTDGLRRGYFNGDKRQNKFKTERNKTEESIPVPKLIHESQRPVSKENSDVSRSIQSIEINEESYFDVTHNNTSDQRILDENGPFTTENQRVLQGDETVIMVNDFGLPSSQLQIPTKNVPVVKIIDGYSVTEIKTVKTNNKDSFLVK